MANKIHRLAPTGNMDKDTDLRYVGKGDRAGDYTDARNIQRVSPDGGVQGSVIPTLGNEFAYDLGSVTQQNKRYRIFLDGDASKQHAVRFLSTQRDANILFGTGPFPGQAVEFNGTVASCVAALQAAGNAGVMSFSATATTVDITMTAYPMYQWYAESVGADVVQVTCVAEAIPVDLAGPLKDIGSYDLLGDLFVFSTTQDNEPTEIASQIILVGPTSGGTYIGPLTRLLFNGNHGLVQGQWIRITGSNEPFLNGLFVVNSVVDATQIEVVTVTAWGVSPPVTTLGTPQVFIHHTGIGEIGVAQKNDNTDSWIYTRLLRSVELNFVSRWQIDCFGEVNGNRKSMYFTDNYNVPRVFYYIGDYQVDGAIGEFYSFGSVGESISMQPSSFASDISLVSQNETGGNLSPGVKYYTAFYETQNGDVSPFLSIMGPVIVYKKGDSQSSSIYSHQIGGRLQQPESSVSNVLRISNINNDTYSFCSIVCIESVGGVITANVIDRFSTSFGTSYTYTHTGFESGQFVDIAEISSSIILSASSSVVKAKNIRPIDSRSTLSNVTSLSDIDFSGFAESMTHELFYHEYDESTLRDIGDVQDPFVLKDKSGFMLNDVYRFGVRLHVKGIGWTDYYWVDDIKIDSSPINSANQGDSRRVSGLPDFNLTSQISQDLQQTFDNLDQDPLSRKTDGHYYRYQDATIDTSGEYVGVYKGKRSRPHDQLGSRMYEPHCKYRSPSVRFYADWSVFIAGVGFLSDVIDSVEFGIGDVASSVKATGIGVLGVSIPENPGFPIPSGYPYQSEYVASGSVFKFPFHSWSRDAVTNPISESPSSVPDRALILNYPFVPSTEHFSINQPSTSQGIIKAKEERDVFTFYSPENIIKGPDAISEATHAIVLGSAQTYKYKSGFPRSAGLSAPIAPIPVAPNVGEPLNVSGYGKFSVFHPFGTQDFNQPSVLRIKDSLFIGDQRPASAEFSDGRKFVVKDSEDIMNPEIWDDPDNEDYFDYRIRSWENHVFRLDGDVPVYPETDISKQFRGVIYCQLFKDEINNFPSKRDTFYRKVGNPINFTVAPPSFMQLDGGDTYTSLFFFKENSQLKGTFDLLSAAATYMEGSMIGLVTQTRINVKGLMTYEQDPSRSSYPFGYFDGWTFEYLPQPITVPPLVESWAIGVWAKHSDVNLQNNIYEINNDYDPGRIKSVFTSPSYQYQEYGAESNSRPTRIVYSEKKEPSSFVDYYRVFLAQNFKDLDPSFGEIIHHENVNGELFTLQLRKWMVQLFNTRGELQVSGSAVGAVIGDGSVLSRDGQTLSRYGTENKWSCVLGTSQGGKDVLYWFNAENGLFMRFGADGTVILSDQRRMRAFSNKAAKWVRGKDTPAFDQGIRAVWDDRNKEAIWTFTGWRDVPQWARPGIIIPSTVEGAVVTNSNAPSVTYENLPRMFRAKSTNDNLLSREPGVGADWQEFYDEIPVTDTDYYSVFTLAHNELTNGFSAFYGHIPKTYLKWRDTFLSSHPVLRNLLFEHRKGQYTTWYGKQGVEPKIEDAHIEMVLNEMPEQTMRGVAVRYLSDNVPDRVDYTTRRQRTHDTAATLTQIDDYYTGPIRNDETVTGDPDSDGQPLSGDYLRIKFTIFGGTYNLLHSMVVKIFDRLRRVNR